MNLFLKTFALVAAIPLIVAAAQDKNYNGTTNTAEKSAAIKKFLREANDPRSALGQLIAKVNKDSEDGRNEKGSISLPVVANDLQVVTISNDQSNPWHYAEKINGYCVGEDSVSSFLIQLSQNQFVHMGSSFSNLSFLVSTQENLKAAIKHDPGSVHCDDEFSEDAASIFGPTEISIDVSDIKPVTLPAKNSARP